MVKHINKNDSTLNSMSVSNKKFYTNVSYTKKDSDSNIRAKGYFIAESVESCKRCKQTTPVFAFLLPDNHQSRHYDKHKDEVIWMTADFKSFVSFTSLLDKKCLERIQKISSNYYFDLSKKIFSSYYMNHCKNCNSQLDDFDMHGEPDGAFIVWDKEDARKIKLYRCNELFEARVGIHSVDEKFCKYMQIIS